MRKHNSRCASRWGSSRVDKEAPQRAHGLVHNKGFQFWANPLLIKLLNRAEVF